MSLRGRTCVFANLRRGTNSTGEHGFSSDMAAASLTGRRKLNLSAFLNSVEILAAASLSFGEKTLQQNMVRKKKPQAPSWNDIEKIIDQFDKEKLTGLLHDLYRLSSDNKDFFYARFSIGENNLSKYKKTIQNSVHPYLEDGETLDIEKANDAISRYLKAVDNPIAEAELRIFYVECGNNFTLSYGDIDEVFYDAMLEMYEFATETVLELPTENQKDFKNRLQKIMKSASGIGWGYYDGLCNIYYEAFSKD